MSANLESTAVINILGTGATTHVRACFVASLDRTNGLGNAISGVLNGSLSTCDGWIGSGFTLEDGLLVSLKQAIPQQSPFFGRGSAKYRMRGERRAATTNPDYSGKSQLTRRQRNRNLGDRGTITQDQPTCKCKDPDDVPAQLAGVQVPSTSMVEEEAQRAAALAVKHAAPQWTSDHKTASALAAKAARSSCYHYMPPPYHVLPLHQLWPLLSCLTVSLSGCSSTRWTPTRSNHEVVV